MHAQAMIAAESQRRRVRALQPHSCSPSLLVNTHPPILHMHVSIRPCPPSLLVHPPLISIDTFFSPGHIPRPYFIPTFPPAYVIIQVDPTNPVFNPNWFTHHYASFLCLMHVGKAISLLTDPRTTMIGTQTVSLHSR